MRESLLRLDRCLTLWMFRALVPGARAGLPVLMYHSISDDAERGVKPYYRVATSPGRFVEQMQWIAERGGDGLTVEGALRRVLAGNGHDDHSVALTFDDGFRDFYTAAWPVLRRHRFTATMYLPTAFIARQRKSFRNRECLTWDEVRELRREGVHFGSHTVNHPKLHELTWEDIRAELTVSRDCLEQELQETVTSFAYPYAFPQEDRRFVEKFVGLVREAGYQHCATTIVGRMRVGDDPFRLKRLPANSCDDRALFGAKLEGAYDWFAGVQRAVRQVKAWTGASHRRACGLT